MLHVIKEENGKHALKNNILLYLQKEVNAHKTGNARIRKQ
jgi:hypothetical protein